MILSQINNVKPEQVTNSEQKVDNISVSPSNANAVLGAVVSEQQQAEWDEVFRHLSEYENEIFEYNMALLKKLCSSAIKNFKELMDCCSITNKIEIVDAPKGKFQKREKYGVFKKVYVDQWSVGMEGDSFEGFVYTNYGKSNKWLKIPYEC
jgi:hypothetical protein